MSYHRSHRLFFGGYWRDRNAVGQLFRINLYVIFCSDSLLPCPVPSSPLLLFSILVIQSIPNLQHYVIPPPPDLYQSCQAYWGTRTPPPIATTTATRTATTCQPPSLIGKRSTCSVWYCHLPLRTVFPPHFCSATEQTYGGCSIHFCSFLSLMQLCFFMAS